MERTRNFTLVGEVSHRHEADALLKGPGTAVLVHREVQRSIVISCPDGCGDTLTINLDRRTGPAWRIYSDRKGVSIYPSVWRDNGCGSHFIVWRSRIYWCDWKNDYLDASDSILEKRVLTVLTNELRPYYVLAEQLDEEPWSVLVACNRLVSNRLAIEGSGHNRGKFMVS